MSDNTDQNEPRLSKQLKVFIVIGTLAIAVLAIVHLATHSGSSEYYRTEIEPDSNLADKELVVKQDTIRRDTASADSANKEEEEQAKKVFRSIRGNVRHNTDEETPPADEVQDAETAEPATGEAPATAPADKPATPPAQGTKAEPAAPRIEKIE